MLMDNQAEEKKKKKENKSLVFYWNMNKNVGEKCIQINGIRMKEVG
jgi:hypothetical protein